MENPFVFGKTVSGAHFINRETEVQEALNHLSRGQNIILYSPRRFGKTSLIKLVLEKLRKKGILTFYIDLYRVSSIEEFYHTFSRSIVAQITSPTQKLITILRDLLPSLHPTLVYKDENIPDVELDVKFSSLTKSKNLAELLNSIETYMKQKGKRACVVFDEFQEITEIDSGKILEKEMRSAFQHHEFVSYAFLGSKNHLMKELFNDKNRPFYNFGVHFPIKEIDSKHWHSYIQEQFSKGGYSVSPAMIETILGITHGHPYYTQLFCSELWEVYFHNKNLPDDCIANTLKTVLSKENNAFQEIWDKLKGRERMVLDAVAKEGNAAIFSKEFLVNYHLGTPSTIQRHVNALIEKDLIVRKDPKGGFEINDPFLYQWLIGYLEQ